MSRMPELAYDTISLTRDDILRLGIEAGTAILAMPDSPTSEEMEKATMNLGMRAVELAYIQKTNPDGDIS